MAMRTFPLAALLAMILAGLAAPARANQFDYGTPDIPTPLAIWRGEGVVRFSHRFSPDAFPANSAPALTLGLGLTRQLSLNLSGSTQNLPLDTELGLHYQLLDEDQGAPVAMSAQLGYVWRHGNSAVGELVASRNNLLPGLGVGLVARYFSYVGDYANPGWMTVVGGGASWAILPSVNLVADALAPLDSTILEQYGFNWSAGLQWWVPDTPHVASVLIGRTGPGTSFGRSLSVDRNALRIGFEFDTRFDVPGWPTPRRVPGAD